MKIATFKQKKQNSVFKDMIRVIISNSNEPSFNLAAEEYFLRHQSDEIYFFYINKPAVIIGKHQNALAEVDINFLQENNISLHRRLSGGGTVYHDLGNINFCFIKEGETGDLVNFEKATQPIVNVLNQWNIPARTGKRNDLLVNFKKISGNACHVFKRRVMHHGTLLYNSDLDNLTKSLKNDPTKFKDRAVKSVRSEVMNLIELYDETKSSNDFLNNLVNNIISNNNKCVLQEFSAEEIDKIKSIESEKYLTPDWNFNYGPSYEFKKRTTIDKWVFQVVLKVEKGIINEIKISSNYTDKNYLERLENAVLNKNHQQNDLRIALDNLSQDIAGIEVVFF